MATAPYESSEALRIATDGIVLGGVLETPPSPQGVAIVVDVGPCPFAGDPDAPALREAGLATFTVDLLTGAEHGDPRRVLDVFLLARRLGAMTDAVARKDGVGGLPIGYLASGTAAAGALVVSVKDARIGAIVCRRGRPDLAEGILGRVTAPTLLMTRRADRAGLDINAATLAMLQCEKKLVIDRGATGSDAATRHAVGWLARHLRARRLAPASSSTTTWPGPAAGTLPAPRRRPRARATG